MKKIFLISAVLLIFCTAASAQRVTEDYTITLPEQKISNSLYKNISYLDSRYDTTNMGIVQLGAFNRKARVIPKVPFSIQLTNILDAMTDSSAKDGEILFQLRQFNFAEITGAMSEKGYCYLRADLYAKTNDQFHKINSVDTVLAFKAADVTRALFRRGSKIITEFIGNSLTKLPNGSPGYSYADIIHIDSIEKRQIKIYNVPSYADGLYLTFKSFMDQTPDLPVKVELKNNEISSVKVVNTAGKTERVRAKDVYAVVHEGKIFIATDYGFYLVHKDGGDFYFTGRAKVNANAGDMIAAGMFFGIIGELAASNANAVFEMKIDHLNGGFIRLREVAGATQ